MSGVRNLRAMFEQKGDSSPPERGRSPGVTSTGTESPRPLSRVHTSFIAIEKDGRIGLQREPSRDSNVSVSTRKPSGELEGISPPPATVQKPFAPAENTPTKASFRDQSIPGHSQSDTGNQNTSLPATKSTAAKAEAPLLNTPQKANVEEPHAKKGTPGAPPTDKAAATGHGSTLRNGGLGETPNGASGGRGKGKAVSMESSITSAGGAPKAATRTAPIMTAKTAVKPGKSPTVAKAPKSPATATPATATPKLSSKTADRKATHPEKTATPKTATSATKTTSLSAVRKPPPLQPSPSSTGFIKPKVKSPTRPVKLPPSLTTHTAASGSRVNNSRQSLSRSSGVFNSSDPQSRSPSRVSVSTVGTTRTSGTSGKSLRRQNSTINRPRPSLGPPPKPAARDHPPTKNERDVDESFLARMMRPTQASSSKTAEKAPLTPPRKTTAAPTLKKTIPKQAVKTVKRPVAKTTPASASNPSEEAQSSARVVIRPAERSSAQVVAPVVEPPAPAEEAINIAKEVDGPVSSPEDAAQDTAPQEIAPVATQLETAQDTAPQEAAPVAEQLETAQDTAPQEAAPVAEQLETAQDTAPQEIVPVAEQLETAQEVAEAAKSGEAEDLAPSEGKVGDDNEETTSEVVDEPEPAPAMSPDAGEPESVEVPTVNGDHEKSAPVQEDKVSAEPALESADEPEAKEVVEGEEETAA